MIGALFRLGWLAVLLGWAELALGSVGFNVNPAVVTNDYFGQITLTITSLPAGQAVRVEKFYDLNGNGVVDGSDLLMQSFLVTDGLVPKLGGVTNLNMPGDTDGATNGQIVVQVNYPSTDTTFNLIEGSYLYRVSSPSNSFTPVTQSFRVWQKLLTQSISGVVYDGGSMNPLSNALAVAFDSNFSAVGGGKANNSGRYIIYVPPGDYTVWSVLGGYLASQAGGSGTVRPGSSVNNADVAMTAGTSLLSGTLMDSATGVGLPGVAMFGYQSSNLFEITFTDASGNYALEVNNDIWEVDYNADQMPLLGYVAAATKPATNVTADVSNFNIPVAKANAVIYGTVRDDQIPVNTLSGVELSAADIPGLYAASGMSYKADGNYTIGVLGGDWWLGPTGESLSALGTGYLGTGTNWVVGVNQAARMDFVARKVTAHIRGQMLDEYLSPVSFAYMVASDPTGTYWSSSSTDALGAFDLGVFAGSWELSVDPSTAAQWYLVGPAAWYSVTTGQVLSGVVYRCRYGTTYVIGTVNNNAGAPLPGIGVWGTGTSGVTTYTFSSVTDTNGAYFAPALMGNWTVGLDCFGGSGLSLYGYECVSSQLLAIAGVAAPANFTAYPLAQPRLQTPALLPSGAFTFTVTGPTNRTYQVLSSSNLTSWTSVFATNPGQGSFQFVKTNATGSGVGVYRAFVQ
jgi:hypothetical protein